MVVVHGGLTGNNDIVVLFYLKLQGELKEMAADESRMKDIKKKNVGYLGFTQMQHQQQKMMEQTMRIF